ncbi:MULTISPECIES: hypothetical protein [unclassified Vibrio]|uniref:hypothetical protein n=1 Tax=unclassified Vibrio TaxID=2614977 RepID=UPI00280FE43F|nr:MULTISPECIES: hypothetical protein [unclassified Vibrio]ELB2875387.1 hypothetical protein [Vibrio alginolyticus]MDW1582818.1 hypothetical protein [Vibrio sp. Vb2897]MDW1588183.1 hypothetical protein [Vibrio sp. Vb2910]MDW1597413.1 hypothetical protein [Vibrio sp. Vb2911]MDW1641079.1 hypothetical protein [Vibrio sp. Vb2896]
MSFAVLPKTKLTQQDAMSESWEDKYPNKCPLWLNIIGWAFVFVTFSLFEY